MKINKKNMLFIFLNNPDFQMLVTAWQKDKHNQNIISEFKTLSEKFKKNIIIWELGYISLDGTNKKPWDYTLANNPNIKIDEDEQVDCFKSFFTAIYPLPFIEGVSIWGENPGLPKSEKGYDFMQKKAVEVIKENFK